MPSGGQIGSGVKIAYAVASPHTWIRVPEIREVAAPGFERDRVETTVHGVTSLRTYIPGLADVSDLEWTMLANLDVGSVCLAISALERSQQTVWWRVEIPNESVLSTALYFAYEFQGRVATWVPETPIDDAKEVRVTVQHASDFTIYQSMTSQIT